MLSGYIYYIFHGNIRIFDLVFFEKSRHSVFGYGYDSLCFPVFQFTNFTVKF